MSLPQTPESRILELAGTGFEQTGERCGTTVCPECGGDARYYRRTVFCMSEGPCPFRRGSVEDFLASAVGGYPKAVSLLFPDLQLRSRMGVAGELEKARELQEFLMRVWQMNGDGHADRIIQSMIAERGGVMTPENPLGMMFLTAEETGELFRILTGLDVTCPPAMHGPTTIVPYWGDPHTVAYLEVFVNKARKAFVVEVNDFRWGMTSLPRFPLEPGRVTIHPTMQQLVEASEISLGCGSNERHAVMKVSYDNKRHGWEEEMVFQGTIQDLMECMPRWSAVPGFEESLFATPFGLGGLGEAMENILDCMIPRPGGLIALDRMLGAMSLGEKTSAMLLDNVFSVLAGDMFTLLERTLTRRLLTKTSKLSLFSCPAGYEAVVKEDPVEIANFTFEPEEVTGFSTGGETMVSGRVRVGGAEFPVFVRGTSLDTPSKLEQEIQSCQILGAGRESKADLATVKDSRLFKLVTSHLKGKLPGLPRTRGTRLLGWTSRRDEYHTPGYLVRHGSPVEARYIPESTSDFHPFRKSGIPSDLELKVPTDPALRRLVATLTGNLSRVFHNKPVHLEKARNEDASRKTLSELFSGIGQHDVVRLTSTLPRNLSSISGHPVLVTGLNNLQLDKAGINGVCLADGGSSFPYPGGELVAVAAEALGKIIFRVAVEATGSGDLPHKELRSVDKGGRAAAEGAALISRLFGIEWPEEDGRFRYLDLLMEKRKEQLEKATAEAEEDLVIGSKILEGVATPSDIAIEMGLLVEGVRMVDTGVQVGLFGFARLYENFHGSPPPMKIPDISLLPGT